MLGLIGAALVLLGLCAMPFFSGIDLSLVSILLGERNDLTSLFLSYLLLPVLLIAVCLIGLTSRVRLDWVAGVLIGAGAVTAGTYLDYVLSANAREGPWLVLLGWGAAIAGGLVATLRRPAGRTSDRA
jgi:hypothetical protein